ncbi:MAG: M90 family metallopeptidase, partial [Lishizhenia sp.]
LNRHIPFYANLNKKQKIVFEDRVGIFLAEIIVTEIDKDVPEKSTCLYVASSAIIAYWGLPYWNYGALSEVLVYPSNFDMNNELNKRGVVSGKVHHGGLMDKTMILSLPALIHGFENQTDKNNVGVHEFAHLLDKADGSIDGLPFMLRKEDKQCWVDLVEREISKIKNQASSINAYGATNKQEFFAVITEYYKERPQLLKNKHPELFEMMERFFSDEK